MIPENAAAFPYKVIADSRRLVMEYQSESCSASELLGKIEAWCVDQYGRENARGRHTRANPDRSWYRVMGSIFRFRDQTDATVFRMRWG